MKILFETYASLAYLTCELSYFKELILTLETISNTEMYVDLNNAKELHDYLNDRSQAIWAELSQHQAMFMQNDEQELLKQIHDSAVELRNQLQAYHAVIIVELDGYAASKLKEHDELIQETLINFNKIISDNKIKMEKMMELECRKDVIVNRCIPLASQCHDRIFNPQVITISDHFQSEVSENKIREESFNNLQIIIDGYKHDYLKKLNSLKEIIIEKFDFALSPQSYCRLNVIKKHSPSSYLTHKTHNMWDDSLTNKIEKTVTCIKKYLFFLSAPCADSTFHSWAEKQGSHFLKFSNSLKKCFHPDPDIDMYEQALIEMLNQNPAPIECDVLIRTFLSDGQHARLIKFFNTNSTIEQLEKWSNCYCEYKAMNYKNG